MASFAGFIASIDFGTTFCGIAFAPCKEDIGVNLIKCPVDWPFGPKGIETKVPTVILFDSKRNFQSFGYQAKREFSRLKPVDKQVYYYFERFKMELHQKERFSKSDILPTSNNPRELGLPILHVFAEALRYLKTYIFTALKKEQGKSFRETDVKWVITVPAIWKAEARQFMREAAMEAGLLTEKCDPRRLIIALEPEGAAIAIEQNDGPKFSKYMIVDCGGGTVDICMHEKVKGYSQRNTIREIAMPSGGKWGGIYVDYQFASFIENVFSADCINRIKQDSLHAWNDIIDAFQAAKRDFQTEGAILKNGMITNTPKEAEVCIDAPINFVNTIEKIYKKDMQEILKKHQSEIKFEFGMFEISARKMKSFFQPVISSLLRHIDKIMAENRAKCCQLQAIHLVGGFSESQLLQNSIKAEFEPKLEVIVSGSAKIDIVRGAVLFGISPSIISERISSTTYGLGVTVNFDPQKHDTKYKFKNEEGIDKCKNIFWLMVQKNTPITSSNHTFSQNLTPLNKHDTTCNVNVYTAENPNAIYTVDRGVKLVGHITHPWPNPENGYDRKVTVTLNFSGTEILATVKDTESDVYSFATVDFFSQQC